MNTFIEGSHDNPDTCEQRDDKKHRLENQQMVRFIDQGQMHMLIDKTQGNDKAHRSRAYTETTGNKDTCHVNFLSPIGEGQVNTLVIESQVNPEVKGPGNDERCCVHKR